MRSFGLTRQLTLYGFCLGSLACSNSGDPPGSAGSGNTGPGGGGPAAGGSNGSGNSGGVGQGDQGNPGGGKTATAGTGSTPGGSTGAGAAPSSGGAGPARTFMPSEGRGGAFVALRPAGGAGSVDVCAELSVVPTPQIPTVAIVLDNSSSMYEPMSSPPANALIEALMNPTTGAIKPLESKVRFGFTTFRSKKGMSHAETDPACADISKVDYALDNYAAIDTAYRAVHQAARRPKGCTTTGPDCPEEPWDTPTGHAITRVAADLQAYMPDPPGRKYILFVTDGTPNTCKVFDPDCGQDQALKAVQDAFAAGIGTFVIGVGNIAAGENCDRNSVRCGEDHLQDIANAGAGAPVAQPPANYWYSRCAAEADDDPTTNVGIPQATYAPEGTADGTAKYFVASTPAELQAALADLLNNVIACTVEMDAIVTGNPALGQVAVAGNPVTYGDPNGWILEANKYAVTLQGNACKTFKDGAKVDIKFPCDPNGNPIAVRR
jgi:hypothetical protein